MQAVHENATLRASVKARRGALLSSRAVVWRHARQGYDEDTKLLGLSLSNDVTGVLIVIWTIIGILLVLWLAGFILDVVGGLIHILLVIALVVFIFRMLSGRKTV